jgi:hypothetical protein
MGAPNSGTDGVLRRPRTVLLLRGGWLESILPRMTERAPLSRPIETCRFCGGSLLTSVFDTAFKDTVAEERLFFAIPGALCVPCRQLYVDQQLIGILGLTEARCTFAIESDRVLRAGAA